MPPPKPTVLVVDRECDETRSLIGFLRRNGFDVLWAHDGEGAFRVLEEERVDCLVAELNARRIEGMALLECGRAHHPEICAVMITPGDAIEMGLEAMRRGAYDFQVKPLQLQKLLAVLQRGLAHQHLATRVVEMEQKLDRRFGLGRLAGNSRAITRVLEQIRHLASTRASVLIEGETGTGKGLVAQTIHQNSLRRDERFVWIDCGALAEDVIESELFGHEKSALWGARRPGRFELADRGTLFLDEIAELPAAVQIKVLRVLQDWEFEPVGGTTTVKVDVRLIAATRRNLAAEIEAGRFREDLYGRLCGVKIAMPTLCERKEDIPLLVESFLREFNREHARRLTGITRGALERLMRHDWPGNVRELRNTIEAMVVFVEGRRPLDLSDLPPFLRGAAGDSDRLEVAVGMTMEEVEKQLIAATLQSTGFDKPRAAAILGIGLRTLYRKIKEYGLR